ncbi:MAG: YHS domain-containing protein [Candidatus Bathyarchaeia archaeon]
MAKDPVCGMTVDEKTAKYKSEYMGKTYYFCGQACKKTFDKDQTKYVGEQSGHSKHSTHLGCCC